MVIYRYDLIDEKNFQIVFSSPKKKHKTKTSVQRIPIDRIVDYDD